MVDEDLRGRGIRDERVLTAMLKVPRHLFVDENLRGRAYADSALPIKKQQTISQPYIVALMTESAQLRPDARVLEVGTGSGYQAAVLAEMVKEVYSIEIIEDLAREAAERFKRLGYKNIFSKLGDGYRGWPEKAPFDAILITAATPVAPQPLLEQLRVGGCMVLPLGESGSQELVRIVKTQDGFKQEYITGVLFVPMTGEVRK
jgi:protein-L-isoaspartate(D-aspartate) O-methyltransferase